MNLFAGLEEIVTENEPLAPHTWLKIGGPARYFVRPTSQDQLREVIKRCRENSYPWRIMGQGANLLVDDRGINCAVIKLNHESFSKIEIDKQIVTVGAGTSLYNTIQETIKAGLSGMEVLVGIPGTIGGAIKMNAGGRFGDIGTQTSQVEVVDVSGTTTWRERPELTFEYRSTNITDQIITRVKLELMEDDPQRILNRMRETWILKKSSQPLSVKSAGCVFKNPSPEQSAGMMIDRVGFKGKNVGDAVVSEQHANFIINKEKATFSDFMTLVSQIKTAVYDRYGAELEMEVEVWQD
jgi:UDP-N-acetylmuramate dehydrogenase